MSNIVRTPQVQVNVEQKIELAPKMYQYLELLRMDEYQLQKYLEVRMLENPAIIINEPDKSITTSSAGYNETILEMIADRYNAYDSIDILLREQWYRVELNPALRSFGNDIIEAIDEDGFLPKETWEKLCDYTSLDLKEALSVLKRIQRLNPKGVATGGVKEFLILQLGECKNRSEGDIGIRIINDYWEYLKQGNVQYIKKQLKISEEKLNKAIKGIQSLRMTPLINECESNETHYIVPSAEIIVENGNIIVKQLQSFSPRVDCDNYYAELYRTTEDHSTKEYLRQNIQEVNWLKNCIERREYTFKLCLEAIIECQKEYFLGKTPIFSKMNLLDISEMIGMSISTVSRAINGKYIRFKNETIPIKRLFEGQTVYVKNLIKEMIGAEKKGKPISDERIRLLLSQRGIHISRRAVNKYRKEIGILNTRQRKVYGEFN